MQGNTRAGFSAKTAIDRKDFGLVWNMVLEAGGFAVADKIEITLEIEAVKAAPPRPRRSTTPRSALPEQRERAPRQRAWNVDALADARGEAVTMRDADSGPANDTSSAQSV